MPTKSSLYCFHMWSRDTACVWCHSWWILSWAPGGLIAILFEVHILVKFRHNFMKPYTAAQYDNIYKYIVKKVFVCLFEMISWSSLPLHSQPEQISSQLSETAARIYIVHFLRLFLRRTIKFSGQNRVLQGASWVRWLRRVLISSQRLARQPMGDENPSPSIELHCLWFN